MAEFGTSSKFCKKSIPTKNICKDIKTMTKFLINFRSKYFVIILIYFIVNLDFTSSIESTFKDSIALIV